MADETHKVELAGQHWRLMRCHAGDPSAPAPEYVADHATNVHDCFSFSLRRILGCLLQSSATRFSGIFVCDEMASVLRKVKSVHDFELSRKL
ncbi:MAG: hypothetical protein EWM72_02912 [Nitrospira sp.]|nr:MAG: hypothetical protein EWM72_02912 [Nitrospira sp.]